MTAAASVPGAMPRAICPTIAAGEEDQGNPGIYAAVIRHLAGDG